MDLIQSYGDLATLLVRVTDNGGETADRYTFYFATGDYICCSGAPTHPQGVSLSGEGFDPMVVNRSVEEGENRDVYLCEVPAHVVQHVIDRTNSAYREHLDARLAEAGLDPDADERWDTFLRNLAEGVRQAILDEEGDARHDLCGPEFMRDVLGADDGTVAVPVRIVDEIIAEAETWYAGDRDPRDERIANALRTLRENPGALGHAHEDAST